MDRRGNGVSYPKWWRRVKVYFVLALFGLAGAFLLLRIVQIKSVYGNEYERRALAQMINRGQEADIELTPSKGGVADRDRRELAVSEPLFDVYMDVRKLLNEEPENIDKYISKTAEALALPTSELRDLLAKNDDGTLVYDTHHKYIVKGASYESAKRIKQLQADDELKHIYLEETQRHTYPFGSFASAVIGFMRGDTVMGLEKQYYAALSGESGRQFRARSDDGFVSSVRVDARDGYTLLTTLDFKLQQSAERIAETYAKEAGAPNASVIVMDPNTGELLAMAQYPAFNLNNPMDVEAINRPEDVEELLAMDDEARVNRLYERHIWSNLNTSYSFEPGSIFKPITVAMALEENVISVNDTYYCGGAKEVAGRSIPCHKLEGHGVQTLEEALANSCNVAMMDIAAKIGRDNFARYWKEFGYGEPTGIDLPAEESGLLFSASQLNAQELATSSFGQRFRNTAIQAVTAFAALINGGKLVQPHVASQLIDRQGNVVESFDTKVVRTVISRETSDWLRTAMEKVVSPSGTGWRAVIEGYAIGGKTGTGEQGVKDVSSDYSYCLSFMAYLPVDNPQYLCFVLLDKVPERSYEDLGVSPAPMLKELLLELIAAKDIPKTYADQTAKAAKGVYILDDFTGMTVAEASRRLNAAGLGYELVGDGGAMVVGQTPGAGAPMPEDSLVFLIVSASEGAETAAVPQVVGLTVPEAISVLEAAGFEPVALKRGTGDGDKVVSQSPESGSKLMLGAAVQIVVRGE